jgi:inner membrane transporter RhtA
MRSPGPAYPIALILAGTLSVQWGAAVAVELFDELGPAGTVFLRIGLAAVMLMVLWRPRVRGHSRMAVRDVCLFGFSLAAMNFSFYEGLDRVPLGIAVTLEFLGPLGVAVFGSRRPRDLLWVALAAGGIVLLSPGLGGDIDALGAAFSLLAGGFWAAYIVLSERIGREFEGGDGLALAMCFGTLLLVAPGVAAGGADLLGLGVLGAGLIVAVLSSAIPYSVELEALRYLPKPTFGVMMSLEPAVAALVGFIALDQGLETSELIAIAMVVIASAGALRTAAIAPRDA